MRKVKRLIQVFLIAVFAVCLVNFVVKKIDIAATEAEIDRVRDAKREQDLRNGELEDMLAEENADDFNRNLAEDNLGFGKPDEIVYQDISGY